MKLAFKIIILFFIFCIGCASDGFPTDDINASPKSENREKPLSKSFIKNDKSEDSVIYELPFNRNTISKFIENPIIKYKNNSVETAIKQINNFSFNELEKTGTSNRNQKQNIKKEDVINPALKVGTAIVLKNTSTNNKENESKIIKDTIYETVNDEIKTENFDLSSLSELVEQNGNESTKENSILKKTKFIAGINKITTGKGIVINTNNSYANPSYFLQNNPFDFNLKALHNVEAYTTNMKHTLLVEIENKSEAIDSLKLDFLLPKDWRLISISSLNSFKMNEKKIAFISFYIPSNTPAGEVSTTLLLKNKDNYILKSLDINFNIKGNYNLDVFNVYSPQQVQAGELIKASFAVKNIGNIEQEINLKSRNTIKGKDVYKIAPDSIIIVNISEKTDSKSYYFRSITTNLEVQSKTSGETFRAFNNVNVFPTKIKKVDAFFRYSIRASLIYNSFTNIDYHFSTISAEITGNGYLDLDKNHFLNFIIRGPEQYNLKRFGVTDQYSLIYKYKDRTTLYLGDHSYQINRLGFTSRYGMGFRVNQEIKDWTLSAFYSKPRLYDYYSGALYGVKSVYHFTDSLSAGLSIVRSKGIQQAYNKNIKDNPNEEGQILTFNLDYSNKSTTIQAESSASITNEHIDFANYLSLLQKFKNLSYFGNFTISGENYFGTINNSLQFSNNLNYIKNKWNFSLGQALSKVNQRLDPLFYAAQPYYENYYGSIGYRFNQRNHINFRFDKRLREDQLEPKNFHYKEYGFNYNYGYSNNSFVANFTGRISKTQNLLSGSSAYRDTYSHGLNLSYRIFKNLRLRGSIIHNYTNRYGISNNNLNYVRYSTGFNYNFNRNLNLNANYNSGFSLEDTYLNRDFITVNIRAKISKNHLFEVRANYFERPGVVNKKELLAFGKYTYIFGAPVKKVVEQGGFIGQILTNDKKINTNGIKIIAAGKTVVTDKNGSFELNNLAIGKNYILVDQSTLDQGVITLEKAPYEVIILDNKMALLNIHLVKSANIYGKLEVDNNQSNDYSLQGYIKIQNDDFTYYTESNRNGEFKFQQIVPGNYKMILLRLKENDKLFDVDNNTQVNIAEGESSDVNIRLKIKAKRIKFNNKNFKVGQ
jgi:hypothetical protein